MNLTLQTCADAQPPLHGSTTPREFLAFKLGGEEYGIDILRVQEIRSYEEPTRVVNAPTFVKGMLNLRGQIVPIIDLRLKFELAQCLYDTFTVLIVLNIRDRVVGMVVDAVSDVITLSPEQMRPVPALRSCLVEDCLLAIGTIQERMLILMDIEKLLSDASMGLMDGPASVLPQLPQVH